MRQRWSVLAVAEPREQWLRELARWSSTSAVAVDLVVAADTADAAAVLGSGRCISCVLADGRSVGQDIGRLATAATEAGTALLIVDTRRNGEWLARGAVSTLERTFGPDELRHALRTHAIALDEATGTRLATMPSAPEPAAAVVANATVGTLLTFCGGGGTGTSTTARLAAQGLSSLPSTDVVLADMCLRADQALLHDVGDVVPGLPELAEEQSSSTVTCEAVRDLTWSAGHLGYHLLLGLRRPEDWAELREGSLPETIASLRRCFETVVADADDDLEGSRRTASGDIERRNAAARCSVTAADLVLVTLRPDTSGLHRLVTTLPALGELGVPSQRIAPVIVASPRNPARRAELVRAIATLADPAVLQPPLHVPERRDLELAVRTGTTLDDRTARSLAAGLRSLIDRLRSREATAGNGSFDLGSWVERPQP